ncbi:MAG: PTS sugar transporter subunit IIA [Rickettsiales bacterium]|jgi:PTS system nitrogen regulatory IIA component|nr:PTS sugar transporter subunit IIA [Rickettsiales bacterium]
MELAALLPKDAVLARVDFRDKKQALKQLASFAAKRANLPEREIYQVLMAREHLGCTGMGGGVCIPHGRFEDLGAIQAVLATLEEPIDFGAADGRPVDIICLLLTPGEANTEHLKALAILSRLLRDKELCAKLRAAKDSLSAYQVLVDHKPE